MVVQKIVEFCKLPKVLPWLSLLEKAMDQYLKVLEKSKDDLPAHCATFFATSKEKQGEFMQRNVDGWDISIEAATLAQKDASSAILAKKIALQEFINTRVQ